MTAWLPILERFGWHELVAASPVFALSLAQTMTQHGGRQTSSAAEARKRYRVLEKKFRTTFEAYQMLGDMPPDFAALVSRNAYALNTPINRWATSDVPDLIAETQEALFRVMQGMEAILNRLELEAGPARRGRPENSAARAVARTLAMLFVFDRGDTPTLGRAADGNGSLTGEFGKAYTELLDALGIRCADPYQPADAAVCELEAMMSVYDAADYSEENMPPMNLVGFLLLLRDPRMRDYANSCLAIRSPRPHAS
jgi:hypothetical protein